ncbi:hypothetical protein ElyMa_003066900 [Elysia marginata]|uniref:Uncharacterized protein n=1 Tax=Elysia marginata TaxID=1093978 RepID=A0AAV4INY2_9GAST|nr:hypothetical protein ElyMa_003066900 [Elysia marginata]
MQSLHSDFYMRKVSSQCIRLAVFYLCLVSPLDAEFITMTNPSKLSSDGGFIREGQPLELDCNLELLNATLRTIPSIITISRAKDNRSEEAVVFTVQPFSAISTEPVKILELAYKNKNKSYSISIVQVPETLMQFS